MDYEYEKVDEKETCNICGGVMEVEPGTEKRVNFIIYANFICKNCCTIESRILEKVKIVRFIRR